MNHQTTPHHTESEDADHMRKQLDELEATIGEMTELTATEFIEQRRLASTADDPTLLLKFEREREIEGRVRASLCQQHQDLIVKLSKIEERARACPAPAPTRKPAAVSLTPAAPAQTEVPAAIRGAYLAAMKAALSLGAAPAVRQQEAQQDADEEQPAEEPSADDLMEAARKRSIARKQRQLDGR